MRHWWWKITSTVLILYSLYFGLQAPLAPGIVSVSPVSLSYGVTSVKLKGYNTHFAEAEQSMQVWLKNGDVVYCPYEMVVVDDAHVRATFSMTGEISESFFDLYVNNDKDGTMVLPSAFLQKGLVVGFNPEKQERCLKAMNTEAAPWFHYPNQSVLYETIRNLLFHVPAWFAMIALMLMSVIYSISYLRSPSLLADASAANAAQVGLVFTAIGLITGSIWARFTWGAWWVSDTRLNGAAISALIYLAYFVLRSSAGEPEKAARLSAVYNIFAFAMMVLFLLVLPRLTQSLHPGVGGNPAFGKYDLDNNLRTVFYPAVIGWIGAGVWMWQLTNRMAALRIKKILR